MERLTQKWCIVALLNEKSDGTTFHCKDWPLHLTIASAFALDKSGQEITSLVQQALQAKQNFQLKVDAYDYWGPSGSIKVSLAHQSPEIINLHSSIVGVLDGYGAVFVEPQYVGKNYKPHLTHQKEGTLSIGDIFSVKKISIIDMFPDEDGYSRRIVSSLPLQNN